MSNIKIKDHRQLYQEAKKTGKRPISYSQISNFTECPYSWKLQHVDHIRDNSASIHLVFGTAMHVVIQEYLDIMFNETIKKANELDIYARLYEEMTKEFLNIKKHCSNPETFATQKDMVEFYNDGKIILDYLKKNRAKYFNTKTERLISIEEPLMIETDSNSHIIFTGFIDVILQSKNTNRYKIIDLKTSTRGWRKNVKSDFKKNMQLVLYKKYYAKTLQVDPKNIDIEFFILKRKLWENADFPQSRIQLHRPASGTPTMNKAEKYLEAFTTIFDDNGKVKPDFVFKKSGGDACKYCDHRTNYDLCPKKERGI